MAPTNSNKTGIWVGRALSVLIVTGAIALGLAALYHADHYPRTDDAEILANFIGIAPQVEGKFMSAFIRATKPANCRAPDCCA